MGSILSVQSDPGLCLFVPPLRFWHCIFLVQYFCTEKRVQMSGPCTNCTDLTLGRQQHALFQIITFYYPVCHSSVKEGERKLAPGWTSLWPDPALSHLSGCVHHPLRHLSRFNDRFALCNATVALVVASSSLRARLQLIMQMRVGKSLD